MNQPKTYLNGCFIRARDTDFGEVLNVCFDIEKLGQFVKAHRDGKYIRICIVPKREADKYGSHTAYLDTFKPNPQGERPSPSAKHSAPPEDDSGSVPF